jgi:hypothetical protein
MTGIVEEWKATIIIIITALPAIGTLLLIRSEAMKRKFKTSEIVAVFFIFWGFLLFAFWENFLLPIRESAYLSWYLGWTFPIFLGLILTGFSIYLICKHY